MRQIRNGIENPTAERQYLLEPNYYRLGYQLAAQLMNVHHLSKRQRRNLEAHDVLYGDFSRQAPAPTTARARTVAERIQREARETLDWLSHRAKAKWWTFPHRPDQAEQRLMQFLSHTVDPCLELVVAASLGGIESEDAEARVTHLRDAAENDALSYRALYNLACYEASGGEERMSNVLQYLGRALRNAPEARQRELLRWASNDPSLSAVRKHREFEDLLEDFGGVPKA